MANYFDVQVLEDGPRNFVVKCIGTLDTSDQGLTTLVSPSMCTKYIPKNFRVDKLDFTVSPQIIVMLWWDGTPDVLLMPLSDFNRFDFQDSGGIQNPAYMPTGNILFSTTGYMSGVQSFTLDLWLVKIGVQ